MSQAPKPIEIIKRQEFVNNVPQEEVYWIRIGHWMKRRESTEICLSLREMLELKEALNKLDIK